VITSDYLLNQGINLLFSKEDFTVDNEIIALLDVSNVPRMINGKTIVVHEKFGIFFVQRTTKQLMNEFHKFNQVGFLLSKALMKYFRMKRNIPMVFGFCSYMPMSGGSRNCTDWIAIHWLNNVEQCGTSAKFETDNGLIIQMDFPKGNLHDRVHDVCFLSEQQVETLESIVAKANMKMIPPRYVGLLNDYNDCHCLLHEDILVTWSDYGDRLGSLENFLLDEITRDEIEADVTKEIYRQKIYRIKKLY